MALGTITINPNQGPIVDALLDKHYLRKHGKDAYYGQK
jgi:ribulose-5-phosphate 4-epimerase/fuculose-1-phosphate aldolase